MLEFLTRLYLGDNVADGCVDIKKALPLYQGRSIAARFTNNLGCD